MAVKIPMKGYTVKVDIALTPTLIPQVTSAESLLGGETAMIVTTDLSSTSEQNTAGLKDCGTMDIKGNWDPSDPAHEALLSQWIAGTDATFIGLMTNTAASTIQTIGPIKSLKLTGGDSNTLAKFELSQKINSFTITA